MAKHRIVYSMLLCIALTSCSLPFTSDSNEVTKEKAQTESNQLAKSKAKKAAEADAKAKKAAELKAKQEDDAKAKKAAELKAKQAADAKAKKAAELKAKQTADAKAKKDAELKAKQAAEAKAKKDAELKAKQAADAKAKKAAELKAKQVADAEAKKAAELKAKQVADAEAKRAADLKAKNDLAAARAAIVAKAKAKQPSAANSTANSTSAELQMPPTVSRSAAPNKLGTNEYNPLGGNNRGNASGSIPEWTGSLRGAAAGMTYNRYGSEHPDPYKDDKPLFTITADNMARYASKLSEGQKALFKKYPATFVMHIYPSHREGRPSRKLVSRTKWNADKTKLVNGIDGMTRYTGGVPFPFPKNGAEAIWNARIIHPHPTIVGEIDDVAVYPNGNTQLRRQSYIAEFPFAYAGNEIGIIDDDIGINAGLIHVTIEEPKRQKGQMTMIHEALDQVRNERKAWVYLPGSRRVRRAPTVGFDTPDGPGGLVTVDDSLGFNGALGRFDWKLKGKKEVYIPYHSYKFDSTKVKLPQLLTKNHANPEYMRYELHRVWIVEATLKKGKRHIYAKRRFYIDEDSWQISLLESYDGRGDLWRVGILNTIYDFSVKGYIARAQVFHDLQSGAYVAMRLINETKLPNYLANPQGEKYYSPSNLRKMGK